LRISPSFCLSIVAAVVLALELFLSGDSLEYRRAVAWSQPWRLLTGHFVHLSLLHALLNCVALLLLGRLFGDRLRLGEFLGLLVAAPLLISLGFWLSLPELDWYRGLSGALHSIYFAGCIAWLVTSPRRMRWLPVAAVAAGVLKVLLEQPWDASFPVHKWLGAAVVPQSHLIGSIVGLAAGALVAARRRSVSSPPPG
jgi:rhomboid family GlyGly-CTERM serine protease